MTTTRSPFSPPPSAAGISTSPSTGSPLTTGSGGSPSKKGHKSTFGVLYTGYLEKMNPQRSFDKPKKRFVVLTHMGIHWFKRDEGYDLFGEERGSISVQVCVYTYEYAIEYLYIHL